MGLPEPLKVVAVTGGRADWGLLSMPLAALRADKAFALSLIVTGQHLVPGEESSLAAIIDDGFVIAEQVDIKIGDDSPEGIAQSSGLGVAGIGATLARLKPDLMILLGDRYEILAAAFAALIARVPIAHLCGGDITEGAMDDAFRHAITKLSHIHFVTNRSAHDRVIQLGENPANVHCVGSPGLDRIRSTTVVTERTFFEHVGLVPRGRNFLVTYHPVTLEADPLAECREMLAALDALGSNVGVLFTGANADWGAHGIDKLIGDFVADHANARSVRTLGAEFYFAALAHVDAVVGNSSSGLYEAPSFATPTVNIGDRQKGRIKASSVIDCPGERSHILAAIERALVLDCTGVVNPYGDGHASERIHAVLAAIGSPQRLMRKHFHDLGLGLAS